MTFAGATQGPKRRLLAHQREEVTCRAYMNRRGLGTRRVCVKPPVLIDDRIDTTPILGLHGVLERLVRTAAGREDVAEFLDHLEWRGGGGRRAYRMVVVCWWGFLILSGGGT